MPSREASRVLLMLSMLAMSFIVLVAPAHPAVTSWRLPNSGSFDDPINWTSGVPASGDLALFNQDAAYTVSFPTLSLFNPPRNFSSDELQAIRGSVSLVDDIAPQMVPDDYTVNSIVIGTVDNVGAQLNTTLANFNAGSVSIAPAQGSDSTLDVDGGTLTVGGNIVVANLGVGHLNVTGNVTLTDVLPLVVGLHGLGTLHITAGGHVNDHTSYVARESGATGNVLIDGAGSSWTNRGSAFIGYLGTGSLTISGGGQVDDQDATLGFSESLGGGNVLRGSGTALVTGASSRWNQADDLHVGVYFGTAIPGGELIGTGNLNVADGGHVNTRGDAFVTAAVSTANVSGADSTWTVDGLLTIERGATVNVTAGGHIDTGNASLSDGLIRVTDAGSLWNIPDTLTSGRSGDTEIDVTGGGRIDNRVALIGMRGGFFAQSQNVVSVEGAGSQWNTSEQLFVGADVSASMLVTHEGQVTSRTGHLGLLDTGIGEVLLSDPGSRWTNNETIYLGVAGTGKLTVSNGSSVVAGTGIQIGPRGTLQGNSSVVAGVDNGGTVAPGLSSGSMVSDALGTLQIDGPYTQIAAGILDIQLASTASFDKLAVNGHVTLDGTLKLSLLNSFSPAVGDTFQVLTATDGITGTLDLEFFSFSSGTGTGFIAVYSESDLVLKFVNLLPGDFNRDGVVDAADYVRWRNTGGTQESYDTWRANFGQTAGSVAGAITLDAAPEPATILMLVMGTPAILFHRCGPFVL